MVKTVEIGVQPLDILKNSKLWKYRVARVKIVEIGVQHDWFKSFKLRSKDEVAMVRTVEIGVQLYFLFFQSTSNGEKLQW